MLNTLTVGRERVEVMLTVEVLNGILVASVTATVDNTEGTTVKSECTVVGVELKTLVTVVVVLIEERVNALLVRKGSIVVLDGEKETVVLLIVVKEDSLLIITCPI